MKTINSHKGTEILNIIFYKIMMKEIKIINIPINNNNNDNNNNNNNNNNNTLIIVSPTRTQQDGLILSFEEQIENLILSPDTSSFSSLIRSIDNLDK